MLYIEYYPEFRYNKEQGQAEDPVALINGEKPYIKKRMY